MNKAPSHSPPSAIILPDSNTDIQNMVDAIDGIEDRPMTVRNAQIFEEATHADCVDYICDELVLIAELFDDD